MIKWFKDWWTAKHVLLITANYVLKRRAYKCQSGYYVKYLGDIILLKNNGGIQEGPSYVYKWKKFAGWDFE